MSQPEQDLQGLDELIRQFAISCYEDINIEKDEAFKQSVMRLVQAEVAVTEKAYGNCQNCYGKGYATVIEYASGFDTDQDIGSAGGKVFVKQSPIRYCVCDRGKQLRGFVQAEVAAALEQFVVKQMQVPTEGMFSGVDLFIKRQPIEQSWINVIGYEKYKAIQEGMTASRPSQQTQGKEDTDE